MSALNTPPTPNPARQAEEVTPSDSADLAKATRAIYVGVTGNVKLTTIEGDTVTFVGCVAGSILPIQAARIWATGTTATNLVALR